MKNSKPRTSMNADYCYLNLQFPDSNSQLLPIERKKKSRKSVYGGDPTKKTAVTLIYCVQFPPLWLGSSAGTRRLQNSSMIDWQIDRWRQIIWRQMKKATQTRASEANYLFWKEITPWTGIAPEAGRIVYKSTSVLSLTPLVHSIYRHGRRYWYICCILST